MQYGCWSLSSLIHAIYILQCSTDTRLSISGFYSTFFFALYVQYSCTYFWMPNATRTRIFTPKLALVRPCLFPSLNKIANTLTHTEEKIERQKKPSFVSKSFFDCCRRNFTSQRDYFCCCCCWSCFAHLFQWCDFRARRSSYKLKVNEPYSMTLCYWSNFV